MKAIITSLAVATIACLRHVTIRNTSPTLRLQLLQLVLTYSNRILHQLHKTTEYRNGLKMPSSVYSFIGVFILCLPTAANGIQDGCIKKDILLTSIM